MSYFCLPIFSPLNSSGIEISVMLILFLACCALLWCVCVWCRELSWQIGILSLHQNFLKTQGQKISRKAEMTYKCHRCRPHHLHTTYFFMNCLRSIFATRLLCVIPSCPTFVASLCSRWGFTWTQDVKYLPGPFFETRGGQCFVLRLIQHFLELGMWNTNYYTNEKR